MAFNTKISNAAAIAGCDAVTLQLNTGGAGRVDIMDGAQPADVSVAIGAQNVLASLPLTLDAFQDAVDNTGMATATANPITTDVNAVAGTASWFRAYNGAGTAVIDGEAGLTASGSDMELDDVTFETGDDVSITSWTVTLPE